MENKLLQFQVTLKGSGSYMDLAMTSLKHCGKTHHYYLQISNTE